MDPMGTTTRRPIFSRLYVRFAEEAADRGADEHRAELLGGLSGRVLEVGAGHGPNFAHYPDAVESVVAVEPEEYLRSLATRTADRVPARVTVAAGVADALPLPDASVDAGIASLVLCSVPDLDRALAELHRVIRPGGELRFYEHVRSRSPTFAAVQRAVDVVWPHVAGGCHAHRDTLGAIERAGFAVERVRGFRFHVSVVSAATAPHVVGAARRR